jgi:pyruvate,water dikinase
MGEFIKKFKEINHSMLPSVGGKGANLGEMASAGFPIPDGFCITTKAYLNLIEQSSEMNRIFDQLAEISADDQEQIRELGKQIREHLTSIEMPNDIAQSIIKAWKNTGEQYAYAVRSSATAEDLPTASFAGQQETFLNVKGKESLLHAVKECWASLFTDRAITYRAKNQFDHRSVFLSVVVQRMVFPEVSGIMFTADPINGHRRTVSIDASFGLGEALVSGLVSADLYQVRDQKIIQKRIATKKLAILPVSEGGTITIDLPEEKQNEQSLSDEYILKLAEIGRKVESHYGSPQDIEWCLVDGEIFIVQSRPITSLYPVPEVADDHLHVMFSFGHQQMMTNAMKPLALSIWKTLFPFGKDKVGEESRATLDAGSRLFMDVTPVMYLKPARKILPRVISNIDERISSALNEVVHRESFLKSARVNPAVPKTALRFVGPILWNAFNNIWFRNLQKQRTEFVQMIDDSIKQGEQALANKSGVELIEAIQQDAGPLLYNLFRHGLSRPLTGILSLAILKKLTKKWLGEEVDLHLLNKSLPGNITSEMGLQMGDLADIVRKYPEVYAYLETAKDETFFAGLQTVHGGEEFAKAFQSYLNQFGMRCPGEIDITQPRWAEKPTLLVSGILSHIRSVREGEHRQNFAEGEREAQQFAEELITKIRKTPFGSMKAKIISRLIYDFRNLMGMREHPKYSLIQHITLYKQHILQVADKLVKQGILLEKEDIYYFSLSELKELVQGKMTSVQKLIQQRKDQFELDEKRTPPRVMTSEGEIVETAAENALAPEGALIGTPVSSGQVEGYARVVLKPEEAKLHEGEILIAPFTDPGWTPLFHSARGLVMEVGGMMTHGAVVAREYGIPAVVGIDQATTKIRDGQYIRVDGTNGFVEIIGDENHE